MGLAIVVPSFPFPVVWRQNLATADQYRDLVPSGTRDAGDCGAIISVSGAKMARLTKEKGIIYVQT